MVKFRPFIPLAVCFESFHVLVIMSQMGLFLGSVYDSHGVLKIFQEPPPPLETFAVDPLCELNLKETSEFVRSFRMPNATAHRRRDGVSSVTLTQRIAAADSPATPGRPVFSFSGCGTGVNNSYGLSRKGFPSKWDDAEKWVIRPQQQEHQQQHAVLYADKSRVTQERVSKGQFQPFYHQHSLHHLHHYSSGRGAVFNGVSVSVSASASPEVLLKDKFTDDVETVLPNSRSSDPSKEGFLFRRSVSSSAAAAAELTEGSDSATQVVVHEVQHRDAGTEMTPRGSSTNSRCHTPFLIPSPPRHNTPADRSGPLPMISSQDSGTTVTFSRQLQECHLAKLQIGANQFDSVTSNWSSREEEEEEVSKSLRHFEADNNCNNVSAKTAYWEEEERNKCCLRYQREEAKIQAWLNLESAKAEAQSRKLEVKIQKMRSNLEEKLMKRMAIVHRKAEEWRAEAREQHSEQIHKAKKKLTTSGQDSQYFPARRSSCGCFH
ncbi:hypothetical protein CDL15_Pgr004873 [Punica granatum]|uniref:Remorin C-terminal domain-containing protein n=1 Tax=Punica granatum TaxID=22663 RepID=A0A218W868_PUNGR|nr:hypothetical protein CDL15_Pgr004873 [Punica granatum]